MATTRKPWLGLVIVIMLAAAASQWWAAREEGAVASRMAAAAGAGDIQMLSSTTCPICTHARQWFTRHGVRFEECFIETESACAQRFEATRSPGTPVIVVRGVPLIGFDPQRIVGTLDARPSGRAGG